MATNELDNDFDTYLDRVDCFNVMHVKYSDRCHFVNMVPNCNKSVNYIPYVKFMGCYLKANSRWAEWVAIIILILLVLYLGLIIAVVADLFFVPALKVVANLLHMNDHLAGVTLVAFGNSSADLLSNIANINKDDPMFMNCMSNSIFITTVAGGLVCYLRPFRMQGYETVRDVLFFITGLVFLHLVLGDGEVGMLESVGCIAIYVFYILVNIADVFLESKQFKKNENKLNMLIGEERDNYMNKILSQRRSLVVPFVRRRRPSAQNNKRQSIVSATFTTPVSQAPEYVDVDAMKHIAYDARHPKNYNLFTDLINSMKPFHCEQWQQSTFLLKLFLIVKTPIYLMSRFCIPIVDVEAEKHGWSKLLNCIQIVINVPMGFIVTNYAGQTNYILYSLVITLPLAIAVFIHSRADVPPFYHLFFAVFCCSASLFLIYACATEVQFIMTLVGNILALSQDFCSATISAWSGSIGDLIANVVLALQGYESMAFAACFGGPFFTLLLSAGIVYTIKALHSPTGKAEINNGNYVDNVYVFLMMVLTTTLVWSTIFNFQARRSAGFFNLFIYGLFLVFAVLSEKDVIHTFNADLPIEII